MCRFRSLGFYLVSVPPIIQLSWRYRLISVHLSVFKLIQRSLHPTTGIYVFSVLICSGVHEHVKQLQTHIDVHISHTLNNMSIWKHVSRYNGYAVWSSYNFNVMLQAVLWFRLRFSSNPYGYIFKKNAKYRYQHVFYFNQLSILTIYLVDVRGFIVNSLELNCCILSIKIREWHFQIQKTNPITHVKHKQFTDVNHWFVVYQYTILWYLINLLFICIRICSLLSGVFKSVFLFLMLSLF